MGFVGQLLNFIDVDPSVFKKRGGFLLIFFGLYISIFVFLTAESL